MKAEAWVIGLVGLFFLIVTPCYWFITGDPTGTAALVMTTLLATLMTFFLSVVARQIPTRPEDMAQGEIADGAGEVGFFPPYSWWPLFCAASLSMFALGIVFGMWLSIIAVGAGAISLCGFVFEYYRGLHAH